MRVSVVCDHAGGNLAAALKNEVIKNGYELVIVDSRYCFR